ncbi:MAG: hypothetical protein V1809_08800 [Planctomycetota bacterium]
MTIMELLVAIALAIVLVGTIAVVFVQSASLYKKTDARLRIYQDAKQSFRFFSRDVQNMFLDAGGAMYNFAAASVTFSATGTNRGDGDLYYVRYKIEADTFIPSKNVLVRYEQVDPLDFATGFDEAGAKTTRTELAMGVTSITFSEGGKKLPSNIPEWIEMELEFEEPGNPNPLVLTHRTSPLITP